MRDHGVAADLSRVPRTGTMTLCWWLDQLGPMARSVEDTLLVLQAISGPDPSRSICTRRARLRCRGNGSRICVSAISPSG